MIACVAACAALAAIGPLRGDAAETATSADAFVDTIGVNTHLANPGSIYFKQYDSFSALLRASGVRHIRDGGAGTLSQLYYDRLNELGRDGIHGDFTFKPYQTAQFLTTFAARLHDSLESFEGPNEPNLSKDPNWISQTRSFQQLLYTTVKADPATQNKSVVGPSIIGQVADDTIGDLSAYLDYGNLHNYFGGRHPGTTGWGRNGYGSIAYNERILVPVHGVKPVITTETGYCNADLPEGVPENIAARYEPRMFLEQHNANIVRTYQYEFIDGGTAAYFSTCGLLHADLSPKPAYNALKSLIAVLADPGPTFTPASLDYTIVAGSPLVQHALFEKRDGTFYIAIWQETSSFDPVKRIETRVAPQTVTLTFASSPARATLLTFDDSGNTASVPLTVRSKTVELSATDHASFVIVRPH